MRGQAEREKSARIAAEERAAELKRYEAYFAHLSDGIAILDGKACVLSLNPAGPEDARRHRRGGAGPAHQRAHQPHRRRAAARRACCSVSRGRGPPGDRRRRRGPWRAEGSPCRSRRALRRRAARSAILSFRDVTAARALADELRKTKDFLERLIDSSVDAIIAADMTGKIILFNKGAEADLRLHAPTRRSGSSTSASSTPRAWREEVMRRLRSPEYGGQRPAHRHPPGDRRRRAASGCR